MAPTNASLPRHTSTIDGEHRIQVGLIHALCAAVDANKPKDEIGVVLDQLIDYSAAHFMSEELLMRLDSYDAYETHVAEHGAMLDALKDMEQCHRVGKSDLIPGKARSTLAFLLKHIDTHDRRYSGWAPA